MFCCVQFIKFIDITVVKVSSVQIYLTRRYTNQFSKFGETIPRKQPVMGEVGKVSCSRKINLDPLIGFYSDSRLTGVQQFEPETPTNTPLYHPPKHL